jgi:hypothetical protein
MDVRIGLQLYSVRQSLARDPWGTNIDMAVFEERKNPLCFTEIGTGVLPIQDIVDAAAKLTNLDYMFLEQDHTTMPEIESIRRSHDAFSAKFTGITWP